MDEENKGYRFYKVDLDYVKYLHSKDGQVFYKNDPEYEKKPHLGLLTNIDGYLYCIPLTSRKKTHLNWANVSQHNYVIYEIVEGSELKDGDIYKVHGKTGKYKKILAVLEIRKMIPVDNSLIKYIDFSKVTDLTYKDLLEKEYNFLKPLFPDIATKAKKLYDYQKETKEVKACYCTFETLENAYKTYKSY